jgi:hypothetical protein
VMKPIFTESGVTPGAGSEVAAPLTPEVESASAMLTPTAIVNPRT